MKGRIHSIESLGTVDGPGIRMVVFFQGCPLRCQYCHNPDTWAYGEGQLMSAEDILVEYRKNASFYEKGGITVTGGEPLLQIDFLTELFGLAKQENIHTCLDTSGCIFNFNNILLREKISTVLHLSDLVLLDIKEIDDQKHRVLTGMSNVGILEFAAWLSFLYKPVWIRHVVIPCLTDKPEGWEKLGDFLGSLKNVTALDILPYHTMGRTKYQELGLVYPLEGIPDASKSLAEEASKVIFNAMLQKRKQLANRL